MNCRELAGFLKENAARIPSLPIVTGFDGFVDEMISVVDQRHSLTEYDRIETIEAFGSKISAAAGHSSLREIVVNQVDPGGCAINMGDGLVHFGLPVTTFATVGEPMHPAFADYASKAHLISWGAEPGKTLAYEFADGKLMFSSVIPLQRFHPEQLKAYLKDGVFASACEAAKLIAITDWTLYPHMTACWQFLVDTVFSQLSHRPAFFFDLVDPSSRSDADIVAMLSVLKRFTECGEVTLGLNQNEANILSRLTDCVTSSATTPELALLQGQELRAQLGVDSVVIHSIKYAIAVAADEAVSVFGPYCEKPVKSTGAGDRFNAGYVLGHVLESTMRDRLTLACASSGYFVRTGQSVTLEQLAEFLETWMSS